MKFRTMKKTLLTVILFFTINPGFAQTPHKRIKIILLGSFHFNQTMDSNSRLHSNLFTPKRQKEIDEIVSKLVIQKPDKIFCEFTPARQPFFDSLYTNYLAGKEPEIIRYKANEIFQLGMKTAKQLGHKTVIGMNYQPLDLLEEGYKPPNAVDSAMVGLFKALQKFEDNSRTNTTFFDMPFPYKLAKKDSLLQKSTLAEFLMDDSSEKRMQQTDYNEWNSAMSYGTALTMTNVDYISTVWYGANLKNYNNVLRQVDYKKDNTYLIIYGSNHIPFLKYLFHMNPFFEVVETEKVLK
jgi:hypothetical protein